MADPFQFQSSASRAPTLKEIIENLGAASPEEVQAAQEQLAKQASLAQSVAQTPAQPKLEPMGGYSQSFSYSGPTAEEKALQAQIYEKMKQSMAGQEEQIAALKEQAAKEKAQQEQMGVLGKIDLRPFAEAMRGYGSTVVAKQEAPQDRTEILKKLNEAITKAQGGLTDDQVNFLKAQLAEKAGMRQAGTEQRFMAAKDKDIFKEVKGAFDPIFKDYNEFQAQASTIKSALDSGETGRLKSAIASIARMQGEKGPLSEGDIIRNVPETWRQKVSDMLAKIDDPKYQADPAVLRIVAANVGALEKAAQEKADSRVTQQETLYQGAPMSYEHHAKALAEKARKLFSASHKKAAATSTESIQTTMNRIAELEAKRKAQ